MERQRNYLITRIKLWIGGMVVLLGLSLAAGIYASFNCFNVIWFQVILGGLTVILFHGGYFGIYRPYRNIKRLILLFIEGYVKEEFFSYKLYISPEQDKAMEVLADMFQRDKMLTISKKQAQYLALQNQINPHFLYNTLEGIRSEAICSGMERIAGMTEALATFFRYTMSNVDYLVTLEDELENIETYYTIQQYRFGDKIQLNIEYGKDNNIIELLSCRMPKLILQPIVENAVYHGIEPKLGNGVLDISIDRSEKRLLIRISDDGIGMEEDQVNRINKKLMGICPEAETDRERQGGVALMNVNNRIKLLFGEMYGVYIYSKDGLGTDVEISLPVILEERNKTNFEEWGSENEERNYSDRKCSDR